MEGIKLIPMIVLLIAITGIIAGASSIVLSKFGTTMVPCANASYTKSATDGLCRNNTLGAIGTTGKGHNFTDQYYTVYQSQEGVGTVSEQVPTVAIIAVMVIIISIIAGVFAYMQLFG